MRGYENKFKLFYIINLLLFSSIYAKNNLKKGIIKIHLYVPENWSE